MKVIENAMAGHITVARAARRLSLSARQVKRLKQRRVPGEVDWMRHGNGGQTRPWRIAERIRTKVLQLAGGKYAGINDSHLTVRMPSTSAALAFRYFDGRIRCGPCMPRKRNNEAGDAEVDEDRGPSCMAIVAFQYRCRRTSSPRARGTVFHQLIAGACVAPLEFARWCAASDPDHCPHSPLGRRSKLESFAISGCMHFHSVNTSPNPASTITVELPLPMQLNFSRYPLMSTSRPGSGKR